jgi:hypothetical protein
MKSLKRFYKFFLYFILLAIILCITSYSVLIFKPQLMIKISNSFGIFNYSIYFDSLNSSNKFFSPEYSFNNLEIKNEKTDQIIKISNIKIGINIIKTVKEDFFSFNVLEIKNISLEGSKEYEERGIGFIKVQANNFKIENLDFILQSASTYLIYQNGWTSINSVEGKLNNMFFEEMNFFLPQSSKKIFYTGAFFFNEKEIKDQGLISLDSFLESSINLKVWSKGYIDVDKQIVNSLNKYEFKDSMIKTELEYMIDSADIMLYENIDKILIGSFKANIPDQKISGLIDIGDSVLIKTKLKINLETILADQRYLAIEGEEYFDTSLLIKNNKSNLYLESDLKNTKFISVIDELSKNYSESLQTSIQIIDLSNPTYSISNKLFDVFLDQNSSGFFAYGYLPNENAARKESKKDGFYIYLNLESIGIEDFLIDSSQNNSSNLKLIDIKVKKFNLFNNIYTNQTLKITFNEKETIANFSSKNLNGKVRIDATGFTRIDVFDTKFKFDGINLVESGESLNNENFNVRFVGKNIQTYDDTFQDVDFYFLRNKNITTIDNIRIKSKNFNIGPFKENKKAYISYNKENDMYKVRGSYSINIKDYPFKNSLNYKFDYLSTDLNIQWNSLNELRNLEGDIIFKIKNLESKSVISDSVFLRALKIFNLNAIIEGLGNESLGGSSIVINRAQGDFYVSQKRAYINKPIKLETNEAKMEWLGEVFKDSDGILNKLNLDLNMRLKVSENIPWYAAIIGGAPALAGGFIFENIIDESLDEVSTFKFKVSGDIKDPQIERLN